MLRDLLTANAEMLNQIGEGNYFGDFDGAFDFIHTPYPFGLHPLGDIDVRVRSGSSPDLIRIHGRMKRMQFETRIAEPVAEFGHLGLVAVIEMLRRAEDFNTSDTCAFHPVEPRGGQAVIDDGVAGNHSDHG